MASLLRQIVAGPRARHPEANLDLCYVSDSSPTIIATSGPSGTYPQIAYRNPLSALVKFLDAKHGENWAIWEFRAEGTGYPDSEVYGRVKHFPWPDHHPPPFALVPRIVGSMRNWLKEEGRDGKQAERAVVVHCKAGKGRSGTISCSYLIAEEGWTPEAAKARFTERRMRPGFGAGISIPSQVRTIEYVDRWTRGGKKYVERAVEVLEVHVWGLRDGVKVSVEGYVEEGKKIKSFHTFNSKEREMVRGGINKENGFADVVSEAMGRKKTGKDLDSGSEQSSQISSPTRTETAKTLDESTGGDIVFRPATKVVLPSSDINIDFERRNKSKYGGFTMVTSVAHVWFNTFFEGNGPEQSGRADDSGVFEIEWDAMDGIKGSLRKGTRGFDRMAVVWKTVDIGGVPGIEIKEPREGEDVKDVEPADWRGEGNVKGDGEKKLGLRARTEDSTTVSPASSLRSTVTGKATVPDEIETVRARGINGEHDPGKSQVELANGERPPTPNQAPTSAPGSAPAADGKTNTSPLDGKPPHVDGLVDGIKHMSTGDLPGGVPEGDMNDHHGHALGSLDINSNFKSSS